VKKFAIWVCVKIKLLLKFKSDALGQICSPTVHMVQKIDRSYLVEYYSTMHALVYALVVAIYETIVHHNGHTNACTNKYTPDKSHTHADKHTLHTCTFKTFKGLGNYTMHLTTLLVWLRMKLQFAKLCINNLYTYAATLYLHIITSIDVYLHI